jgi:hypothetical protein
LSQVVEGDGGGGSALTLEGAAVQGEAVMQERERERERELELRAEWRRREDAAIVCQRVCRCVDPGGGVPCARLRWTRQHIFRNMCCRVVCTNPKL